MLPAQEPAEEQASERQAAPHAGAELTDVLGSIWWVELMAKDPAVGRDFCGRLFGWQVHNALGMSALLLFLAGFALLVAGPHPWRATRWAWFWLLLPPVGVVVYLVLSGPTPGVPGPRNPQWRLTGGWAFLLSLPLTAVLAPYRG